MIGGRGQRTGAARRPRAAAARRLLGIAAVCALTALGGCGGEDEASAPPAVTTDEAFVVRAVDQVVPGIAVAKLGSARSAPAAVRRLSGVLVSNRERAMGWLADRRGRLRDIASLPDLGVREDLLVAPTVAGVKASRPFAQAYLLTMLRNGDAILALVRAQQQRGKDSELTQLAGRLASDVAREQARIRDALAGLAGGG